MNEVNQMRKLMEAVDPSIIDEDVFDNWKDDYHKASDQLSSIGKTVKSKAQRRMKRMNWSGDRSPQEIQQQIGNLSDETLMIWSKDTHWGEGEKNLQTKIVKQEMARRGLEPLKEDEVIEEGLFSTIRDLASVASNQGINLDVNSNIKGAINDKSAIQKFMVMLTKNGFQSTERNTVWSKGAQRVLLGIDRQNKVYTVTVPSQG